MLLLVAGGTKKPVIGKDLIHLDYLYLLLGEQLTRLH
jgi:hypothetical protein